MPQRYIRSLSSGSIPRHGRRSRRGVVHDIQDHAQGDQLVLNVHSQAAGQGAHGDDTPLSQFWVCLANTFFYYFFLTLRDVFTHNLSPTYIQVMWDSDCGAQT